MTKEPRALSYGWGLYYRAGEGVRTLRRILSGGERSIHPLSVLAQRPDIRARGIRLAAEHEAGYIADGKVEAHRFCAVDSATGNVRQVKYNDRRFLSTSRLPIILVLLAFSTTPVSALVARIGTHGTRTVTVGTVGFTDFVSIRSALAYVAGQTRTSAKQWRVEVEPAPLGAYMETTGLVVPSWTTVEGVAPRVPLGTAYAGAPAVVHGVPVVELSATSGALISLGDGAGLSGLVLHYSGATTTAAVQVVLHPDGSGAVALTGLEINIASTVTDGFAVDGVSLGNGGGVLRDVAVVRVGTATRTRALVVTGTGTVEVQGGRYLPGTSQAKLLENASTGTLALLRTRLGAGATADITNGGGGTVTATGTAYTASAATIAVEALPMINGTSRPTCAATSPISVFVDTTGGALKICACIAAAWKCAALT